MPRSGAIIKGYTNPDKNKNLMINGDMAIAQRGTSFVSPTNGLYMLDRWLYGRVGVTATHTVSQDTDVPTFIQSGYQFQNSLRLNLTLADTSITSTDASNLHQIIEGYNFRRIAQKTFTLSFWVKATLTGIYCVSFRNSISDRSYVAEYTINAANTWEYKTITVSASPSAGTWDYTSGVGLRVTWSIACGSSFQTTPNSWQTGNFICTSNQVNGVNTGATDFRITGVMLNEGSSAAPFRLFGNDVNQEIEACQRYYEKSYDYSTAPGTSTNTGSVGYQGGANQAATARERMYFNFRVEKRSAPTINFWDTGGNASKITRLSAPSGSTGNITPSSGVIFIASTGFQFEHDDGANARNGYTFQFEADAEL